MGTIAEKLSYLNTTKEKIRDSINLTGANIGTSDTFRSYASKLKKGYIDIINNGTDTLYNNFPKVSGIGSNLSLTPTYEAPMKLNEIQGDTSQDGTPTPDTPVPIQSVTGLQNINVCGKNLFDKDNTNSINAYINGNTMKFTSSGTVKTYYITCKPNTTYTIQKILSNQFRVGTSSDIPVIDGSILQFWQDNSATQHTITTDANAKYLCICIYNSSGATITEEEVLNSVMLNKGTTALPYEPYKGNTYEVNLGNIELNKISTYEDRIYKDNGKWYIEKNIGKVVLDNTLSSVGSTNFSNVYQIYANVMNISYLIGGFCDNFKFNDDSRITDNTNANNYLSDNQCALRLGNESARDRFYVKSTNFASANELKAYFNTNPTTLYYVLATPTYEEITNTELIEDLETLYTAKSQEGTTNISITSEDLEMILNVSALKGEV